VMASKVDGTLGDTRENAVVSLVGGVMYAI
jgi:hypothetical protein